MAKQLVSRNTTLRSPLGRVRSFGSAHAGVHHWWMQRVTSLGLLPLTIWFVFSAASLAGAGHEQTVAWIARPWNAVLLLITIGASFYHTALGVQVIVEDYTNSELVRTVSIMVVKAACWILAVAASLAVLKIAV